MLTIPDPTAHRMRREDLEQSEGTPRAALLEHLKAAEFAVTQMLETAGPYLYSRRPELIELAGQAYDHINAVYLDLSPEVDTAATDD